MKKHLEERLQRNLDAIGDGVRDLGSLVESALQDATRVMISRNSEVAADIVIGDLRINRVTRDVDRMCHHFVARHLPSAGVLRYVSSVLRLCIALERIGDYATTIARTSLQLSEDPPGAVVRDVEMMGDQAKRLLHQSLKAFYEQNADSARGLIGVFGQHGPTFDKVFADLVKEAESRSRPAVDLFSLLATFNRLERVLHQAKNICEETIFSVTGETKGPKTFHILFLDAKDEGPARLAVGYARKAFTDSGTYESAGFDGNSAMASTFAQFASSHGLTLEDEPPRSFDPLQDRLGEFQFIVDLRAEDAKPIGKVPFHTVILRWPPPEDAGPEAWYRLLSDRIADLMERLRGRDVS